MPFPSPGDLPNPGTELVSPSLADGFFTTEPPGKPCPFRYDLNQIPYDYTVEVMNRFKGLDQVDRVSEEIWTEIRNIISLHTLII